MVRRLLPRRGVSNKSCHTLQNRTNNNRSAATSARITTTDSFKANKRSKRRSREMDQGKWTVQSWTDPGCCIGDEDEEANNANARAAAAVKGDRYPHDIEQAMLLRRKLDASASEREREKERRLKNVTLGMSGLDAAELMKSRGELEDCLKVYELSLELLIAWLRNSPTPPDASSSERGGSSSPDRSAVEQRVMVALSDAETVKAKVGKAASPSSLPTKSSASPPQQQTSCEPSREKPNNSKSSVQSLLNSLSSAVRGLSPKTSTGTPSQPANTTRGTGTTTNAKKTASPPSRKYTGKAITASRNPAQGVQHHPSTARVVRPAAERTIVHQPATEPRAAAAAGNEVERMIMADFYVAPSDLRQTTWDDIAGLDGVKRSLQETAILPLLRPDLFGGLRRPQNILLWGPPGTGKTMLVRAVAKESGSSLFVCSASSLTSKWMGEAEKLVRALFAVARRRAPSIIFLDEMDSVLSARKSDGEHEASRRLKTEFMVQMDGIHKNQGAAGNNNHVLLLACTNCPWDVDSAVLRRFPKRQLVPLPDGGARRGLLEALLKKAGRHDLSSRDIASLAKRLSGFSCSDISAIASEAAFGPIRSLGGIKAIQNVRASDVRPISARDFDTAIRQATKSVTSDQLKRYDDWQQQQQAAS